MDYLEGLGKPMRDGEASRHRVALLAGGGSHPPPPGLEEPGGSRRRGPPTGAGILGGRCSPGTLTFSPHHPPSPPSVSY